MGSFLFFFFEDVDEKEEEAVGTFTIREFGYNLANAFRSVSS